MKGKQGITGRLAGLAILAALLTATVAACVGSVSPPGADKVMGSFAQGGYLFLRWPEGLAVMIWHDLAGEGTGHSAGSNAGRTTIERGAVRSADGRSLTWELHTADGRTGEIQIAGARYDLAAGTLFVVTTEQGTPQVRQLVRDLSALPLGRDEVVAFASNDPDLAPLLDDSPPVVLSSVTPTPLPTATVAPSATRVPTRAPVPSATPAPSATSVPTATPTPTTTSRPATPTPSPAPAVERIRFPPGSTQATIEGYLPEDGSATFVMGIAGGQFIEMNAAVGTTGQGLRFSLVGADGFVVKPMGDAHIQAVIPSTQDYTVTLVSDVGATSYRLSVLIPVRIRFAPGAISSTVTGSLEEGGARHYVLRALAGQRLRAAPHTTTGQVGMVISGVDGQVLLSGRVGEPGGVYDGILPTTQDYLISVQALGGIGADYTLEIAIPAETQPDVTILGTVLDVSLSARVIALTELIQGFAAITLTGESKLFSPSQTEITLRDIRPGMRIQASGRAGGSQALLASEVHLLP
jgi:hypothetical protein